MLIPHPRGHYRFLQGIDPYSCGVIAATGYEIVHVTLAEPLPWRAGFDRVDALLDERDRGRRALCAMELRSPAPFTMQGFRDFNAEYCGVLQAWDLYVDGQNPIARTNVAPAHDPPTEPVLYAFSYVRPNATAHRPTFVVAGAGELREGVLDAAGIIRAGDTSHPALCDKAAYVMQVMTDRLQGLGAAWEDVRDVNVYTIHPLAGILEDVVLPQAVAARRRGVHWHVSRPPVVDIEYEMDLRGTVRDEVL